ncbi:MerR family transcriptional regulator [Kitasatospora sp. RG8]|uniref:MerR family transcriptional regulator n=1 Tax=Kitasatospora sp. RG8 TaxID=2820815 RepID=UPI001ADF61AA|nr:MerR family transcriptional regulator [Kitasatospora sp. RG8]MBP0448580.1 MerR family transcriptional regulator [Kitasatospora sp. RG8]
MDGDTSYGGSSYDDTSYDDTSYDDTSYGDSLYSIGDLARRTGLTVKTVRFYSDQGLVAPADRNPAGHRRYDVDAVARLDLVRTLRELGLGLPAIRQVVERERSLPEAAAAHADALGVQIRVLRLRRAVLTAVAQRGATEEETHLMHRLAKLSEDERHRLIGEFLDEVFGEDGGLAGVRRSLTPELPDDATAEQVVAWLELAELSRDTEFRSVLRRLVEDEVAGQAAANGAAGAGGQVVRRDLAAVVRELAGPAVTEGVGPGSPRAAEIVGAMVRRCVRPAYGVDGVDGLVARLERMADPRRERYLRLLAVVNGWLAPESSAEVLEWAVRALRAR